MGYQSEWEASLARGRAIIADEVAKSREADSAFSAYLASKLNAPTVPDAFAAGFRAGKLAANAPPAGCNVIDVRDPQDDPKTCTKPRNADIAKCTACSRTYGCPVCNG